MQHPFAAVDTDGGQHQVFEAREIRDDVGDLKRAAHAEHGAAVLGQACDVLTEEGDAACGRRQRSGDAVEQRRLARAVRADEHAALAGGHAQRHPVDGAQAAKLLHDLGDLDGRGHARAALPRSRAASPTSPSGTHSTAAMKTMPMMAA